MQSSALDYNLNIVKDLEPALLWHWFATIASIPHPSHHEEALADFIVAWAKKQDLTVWRDTVGNIIIKKPASEGMQERTPMVLQAHLDMVPQANAGVTHNFAQDPLKLRQSSDGKWLLATDTTLGADNGIGLASILALLESDLPHPELEALLTMTEETGMVGVMGLQAGTLSAPILINTDTEEIGEVYVGCAGGVDADVTLPLVCVPNTYDSAIKIDIGGLRGGHSGLDINKNRSNAIKLLSSLLAKMQWHCAGRFAIAELSGGTLRNAIARESGAVLVFDDCHREQILSVLKQASDELIGEIIISEPNVSISHQAVPLPQAMMDSTSTATAVHLINALPSGVVRQSDVLAQTVETSLSLGVLSVANGHLQATLLIRSLSESAKQAVCRLVHSVATLAGASAKFSGDYVGWNVDKHSKITPIVSELYAKILGKAPDIKVIHAGLECGLIKKNYPDMDMVSIGPTIKNAHSPDECVDIDSVALYWQLLTDIVANAPSR